MNGALKAILQTMLSKRCIGGKHTPGEKLINSKIKWLEVKDWPDGEYMQNSVLSAEWIELEGVNDPVLEVYGKTHMGNGEIYLFKAPQRSR